MTNTRSASGWSSYLSQISQIIFVEKNDKYEVCIRLELTPGSRASPVEATGSTAEELLLPGFVQTINKLSIMAMIVLIFLVLC